MKWASEGQDYSEVAKREKEMKDGEEGRERWRESVCIYFCVCRIHHRRPWHTLYLIWMPDEQKDEC